MDAGEDRYPGFVDLVAGRPWQTAAGEGGVPEGLQIDLGLRFPVHTVSIVVQSAVPGAPEPRLHVAFSDDGEAWRPPDGTPLVDGRTLAVATEPGEPRWTRHVRIAVEGPAGLGIGRARVWCEEAAFDLVALRRTLGAEFDIVHEGPGKNAYTAYDLVSADRPRTRSLVGIAMFENGAFGNCLVQYLLAISVARNLRLKYIKLPKVDRSKVIFLTAPLVCEGITFVPAEDPLPDDGYFLSGMFFDIPIQKLSDLEGPEDTREIVRTYIRRLFNGLPQDVPEKPDDALLIHIRSGDIFSTWVDPHYPQPPLAFYQLVIQRLLSEGRIASVRLVYENRLNPVIPELEAHIAALGLPFTVQSGSLVEDVAALVNGRYLAFGLGTFGPGICHLSDRIEQVFYFSSGWPQGFQRIPSIGKVVEVRDIAGGYTKVGEWDNSDARRQLMVDYPIANLAFEDAAG